MIEGKIIGIAKLALNAAMSSEEIGALVGMSPVEVDLLMESEDYQAAADEIVEGKDAGSLSGLAAIAMRMSEADREVVLGLLNRVGREGISTGDYRQIMGQIHGIIKSADQSAAEEYASDLMKMPHREFESVMTETLQAYSRRVRELENMTTEV